MKIGSMSKEYTSLTRVPEWAFRYWGHNVGMNFKNYQSESKIYTWWTYFLGNLVKGLGYFLMGIYSKFKKKMTFLLKNYDPVV